MATVAMVPTDTQDIRSMPVEVYLNTAFRPDCEYIDGDILERNVGEIPHGTLQAFFVWYFRNHLQDWKVRAIPEQRVQVSDTRYRIPDVCVIALDSTDKLIVREPPLLCIEVLSQQDRMGEMQDRIADYARMGVRAVWIIDPWRRRAFSGLAGGGYKSQKEFLEIPGTQIRISLEDVFRELDSPEIVSEG